MCTTLWCARIQTLIVSNSFVSGKPTTWAQMLLSHVVGKFEIEMQVHETAKGRAY